MKVIISVKFARVKFHGCTEDYIKNVCHGRCCDNTKTAVDGIPVTAGEAQVLLGFPNVRINTIDDAGGGGLMQAIEGKKTCPMHGDDGLCTIHMSGEKPVGCHCAPFYVKNGKLVLRYRYLVLKCHLDWKTDGLPAYKAFAYSLVTMFGETEAQRITDLLDSGVDKDFEADMIDEIYALRAENTETLRSAKAVGGVKR